VRPGFRFSAARPRPRRRNFKTEANQAYGLTPAESQPLNGWKKVDFETTGLVQRFARLLGGDEFIALERLCGCDMHRVHRR
jgi:hypothetical protein